MEQASARQRFDRWARWSGLSDAEIARRLECDASLPGKLRRPDSDRRPGLELAHAIERITGAELDGRRWREPAIVTEEWLDATAEPAPPKKARRRAGARRAAA